MSNTEVDRIAKMGSIYFLISNIYTSSFDVGHSMLVIKKKVK